MIDEFMRLSAVLTGEVALDCTLAQGYLDRIHVTPEASQFQRLLDTFLKIEKDDPSGSRREKLIRERIMSDDALRALVKMIVLLWYTGELVTTGQPSSIAPEAHFSGLLWRIVHAHPPGLSGGYFGHWTYPPDN